MKYKKGTRVKIEDNNAEAWGYKIPANGTVIGSDPDGLNVKVVAVRLDECENSIYEVKGVNVGRLELI